MRRLGVVALLVAIVGALLASLPFTANAATESLFSGRTPATASDSDTVPITLGTKVTAVKAGTVTGVKFYKGTSNTGTHVGAVYVDGSNARIQGNFSGETSRGWQTWRPATALRLEAGTQFTVAVYMPRGRYASSPKQAWPATTASLSASGAVYQYGTGLQFPASAGYQDANYFVDVEFTPEVAASPSPSATPSATPTETASPSATPPETPTATPTPSETSATPSATPSPSTSTDAKGTLVQGRYFPNEDTTGVPDSIKSSLTKYTGSCTITDANVKIDRKIIDCDSMRLLAPGIEITNSIINGTVFSDCCYLNGGFSLADSEVIGPNSTATVVGEARFKLIRVEVSGGSRSVNCNDTCEIRDSYIHGQYKDTRGIDHESGIRQDSHGTFVHNTISCDAVAVPNPNGGEGSGCSAAVSGYGDFGTVNNNTFDNNLIDSREGLTGQAASSYCVYGGSTQGKPYPNAHHIVFTNNIFRRGGNGKCGIYGPVTSFDSSAEGSLWQNNIWDTDGTPVPPAN